MVGIIGCLRPREKLAKGLARLLLLEPSMQNGTLFIRLLVVSAMVAIVALVLCYFVEAERIYEPGLGTLGADASKNGPRLEWSKVKVPAQKSAQNTEAGDKLFTQWCASCHGSEGKGDGTLSLALNPPPRNFTKGRFRFISTPAGSLPSDGDLFRTISAGILPARMPSFQFLDETSRWALVDKVKRLSKFHDDDEERDINFFEMSPAKAEMPMANVSETPDAAAIERGKHVYLDKAQCNKCHGDSGRGDGPSAAELKAEEGYAILPANLRRGPAYFKTVTNSADLYRVFVTGLSGTPMPSYASSLSEPELRDLAAFVSSLWKIEPRGDVLALPNGTRAPSTHHALVQMGEKVFRANCAGCHGKIGRGDGPASAELETRPGNLASGVFKFKSVREGCFPLDEDLKRTIRLGVPGSSMPAWKLFSESETQALVEYLRELSGMRARVGDAVPMGSMPRSRLGSAESIEAGKKLFSTSCAVCHGSAGRGDGDFAKILQDYRGEPIKPRNFLEEPMKAGSDPASLFRTISLGFEGTPMPGFAAALGENERWDLVSYLLSLRSEAQKQ